MLYARQGSVFPDALRLAPGAYGVVKIKGDGNCLYGAFSCLFANLPDDPEAIDDLRVGVAMRLFEQGKEDMAAEVLLDGRWGENEEISAQAAAHDCTIELYLPDRNTGDLFLYTTFGAGGPV